MGYDDVIVEEVKWWLEKIMSQPQKF
jgi:hypothetical protein